MLRSLQRIVHKRCHNHSIKRKSTTATTTTNNDSKRDVDEKREDGSSQAATKQAKKLLPRQPLAKNFFIGVVDRELLGYPEVITRDDMKTLQNELLPLKNFFSDQVDNYKIDATRSIPTELMENVRQLGLYGINVPEEFEGKGWNWSQSLMAMEVEANCTDIALALKSHRVIIDVIKEMGTEQQRQYYLSKLVDGSFVATEAIFEYNVPDQDFFNTKAEYDPNADEWLLNGAKAFVVAGPLPGKSAEVKQFFLVIAQTQRLNMSGDASHGTTIFLVDSSLPGIKLGEQHLTIGCRGVQMHHVSFEKVHVPNSCVLGYAHEGNQVADVLLRSSRLRNSMIGFGLAKNLLNDIAKHCINSTQCGVPLQEMEMTQVHLSKTLCSIYAMESMIYLNAGLLDEFCGQDVTLEAAITKYFTLKELKNISTSWLEIVGPKSLHSGEASEVAFRNAAQLYTQGESIDSLRLYIGMTGLQHAGAIMNDSVGKSRNPLFHPGHIFGKFMQSSSIENPKTKMRLNEHLHPSLESAAQYIEHSVARLQMSVELLLTRHGSNIVERHNELERLAEMSSIIYGMFASAARASRSYCIGLQYADHEMLTALAIAAHGRDMVKTLCIEIFNGQYVNNDNNLLRLSKQIARSGGYFPTHPLTFNF